MSTKDEAEKFFDSADFDLAFDSIDDVIDRLQKEHHPTDNMDCSCGKVNAFLDNNRNPLTNEHLVEFYLLEILYTFEKHRKDVIRIEPGDDDPLADRTEKSVYGHQKEMWMKYVSGTRYPMTPGTSTHSSTTMPIVSAPRGGIVYRKSSS